MFTLYNALLRGFGFCGAVAPGIDFASDEFWAQWKAVDINAWVKRSGHRFTNTIHALASAIKKLQGFAAEEPSTRLYRGLGGLNVAELRLHRQSFYVDDQGQEHCARVQRRPQGPGRDGALHRDVDHQFRSSDCGVLAGTNSQKWALQRHDRVHVLGR